MLHKQHQLSMAQRSEEDYFEIIQDCINRVKNSTNLVAIHAIRSYLAKQLYKKKDASNATTMVDIIQNIKTLSFEIVNEPSIRRIHGIKEPYASIILQALKSTGHYRRPV